MTLLRIKIGHDENLSEGDKKAFTGGGAWMNITSLPTLSNHGLERRSLKALEVIQLANTRFFFLPVHKKDVADKTDTPIEYTLDNTLDVFD